MTSESPSELLLRKEPHVINIGVADFAESLEAQGAEVVHVNWTPPAGGDVEAAVLASKLL